MEVARFSRGLAVPVGGEPPGARPAVAPSGRAGTGRPPAARPAGHARPGGRFRRAAWRRPISSSGRPGCLRRSSHG
ncbi:MAG: hypothetical protein EOO24_24330 [Comamonadaceae bacterium]|nr:MAG: hypothetical protein EOO24_24330 [Comamonadaceae bacterium]